MTLKGDQSPLMELKNKAPRLEARARIINAIREMFCSKGYLEISTPIRISAPAPERHIDTFQCGDAFLIASPELQMKQMVAAGYDRIFQFQTCFRQGERGQTHLPEFTILEWYQKRGTLDSLADDCRQIVKAGHRALAAHKHLPQSSDLQLDDSWPVWEVADLFEQFAGWRPDGHPDETRFEMDLVDKVEPALPPHRPCFMAGYPASMASLAKLDPQNPNRALRMEFYLDKIELANGFEELTDASEQANRFKEEEALRRQMGKPPYPVAENFLNALRCGLPPCAGMALGVDRLVMCLTGATHIDQVVAFC